jgi:cytochrome b561
MSQSARSTYSSVAIALHWLIALIIIANIIGGLTLDTFLDSPDAQMKATGFVIIGLHKAAGLAVIALTLLRIVWRLVNPPPPLPAHMTAFERILARVTVVGFYALMLLLPLSGWAMSSASPKRQPISFFGLFDVPYLPVEVAREAARTYHERHEQFAYVAIALIVVHVGAALKHHFMDRDDVLTRMMPWHKARA